MVWVKHLGKESDVKRLWMIAALLACSSCGSKVDVASTAQSRPILNHIIACKLDQTADDSAAFDQLKYAITGIEIDVDGKEANLKINRADTKYRDHALSSHYFDHGSVTHKKTHTNGTWGSDYKIALEKTSHGYKGNISVKNLPFNISCQDSVSKPAREIYQCAPIGERRTFFEDGGEHIARRFDVTVYDDNDVSVRIVTKEEASSPISYLLEQGFRQMRRNRLHFSWVDQDTGVSLDTKHPKYRGDVYLFEDYGFEVECVRRF